MERKPFLVPKRVPSIPGRRVPLVVLLTLTVAVITLVTGRTASLASDCRRITVNLTPITELDRYQGYRGGLYPEGQNVPPAEHLALAMSRAAAIQPLAADGSPSSTGRIVLLSIGMTNASLEFEVFAAMAASDPQVNPRLLVVNGAQPGQYAATVRDPAAQYWQEVDNRLQAAGATREQVQVIWLKQARWRPQGPFPEHADALRDDLEAIARVAYQRFPNLKLLYLSSRIYAGYATVNTNPEPYAYESAFAVQWLIGRQIAGAPSLNADPAKGEVHVPVMLWGPYMWADGMTPRQDGLQWLCGDFAPDGTHPSASGRQKVANMLMAFFKTDPTARDWFMANAEATPLATATVPPTVEPPPTSTRPGRRTPGPRPTRGPSPTVTPGPSPTPVPLFSYRIEETPSGDRMWISTRDPSLMERLEAITPQQSAWVCGRVVVDPNAEWGFRLRQDRIFVLEDPPQQIRSTIREIAASPPTGRFAVRCIHVGAVVQKIEGPPPTLTPAQSPTPMRSPPPTLTPLATPPLPGAPSTIYLPLLAGK